ncbi:hypothetical protein [Flavicella sediminum]|uniref:hypothetical protein n=1 Tax=Flavicella sediminum TaxID=2585141 RepID=UPI00111F81A8|nr:hypothetical protein [Flavicella sediminum]
MKTFTQFFLVVFTSSILLISCEQVYYEEVYVEEVPLNSQVVEDYDLWYVDYHRTEGNQTIPFLTRAFTISFVNGNLYANNNISGIGITGNGYGIEVGSYDPFYTNLRTDHTIDGFHNFEIEQLSLNEIRIYNAYTNSAYYLIGYNLNDFDYDKLFYENIEYLLQDYEVWGKENTSNTGAVNDFDNENFLQFTPENNTTFYSSNNVYGTEIGNIDWSYVGGYEVYDVDGYEDLKVLILDYSNGDIETFELSVVNDTTVELYHIASETVYTFKGINFIQYLKGTTKKKSTNSDRVREKIKRKSIKKISY